MSTNKGTVVDTNLYLFFREKGDTTLSSASAVTKYQSVTKTGSEFEIVYRRSNGTDLFSNYHYQIELGSTATDYEPYQEGGTYTTALGQTVYGGTLDVVSGELVVDRAMVDLGSLSAVYNSTWQCWYLASGISGAKVVGSNNYAPSAISDRMTAVKASGYTSSHSTGTFSQNASGAWFFDNGSGTQLNGTLIYELATPQTIQLTPQEVRLLLGTNNIWSDGNVTLEYSADIQKWVEKKLNGNSTTLTMSRPMVQTEETETETETE